MNIIVGARLRIRPTIRPISIGARGTNLEMLDFPLRTQNESQELSNTEDVRCIRVFIYAMKLSISQFIHYIHY